MVGFIGLLVGIAILVIFAYKGFNVYVYSFAATLVVLVSSGLPIFESITGTFMGGFVSFFKGYFLLMLTSSLFSKVMGESGACSVICLKIAGLARKCKSRRSQYRVAIWSLVIIEIIAVAGGINSIVIVFIMVDIAKKMFKDLDIPWHLLYLAAFGTNTVSMTMLPGVVSLPNIVPTTILGTNPMAGPIVGILASVLEVVLCTFYIEFVIRRNLKTGERFMPTGAIIESRSSGKEGACPDYHMIYALLPCVVVLVLLNVFHLDAVLATLAGSLSGMVLFHKTLPVKRYSDILDAGIKEATMVTGNVGVVVGFGAVVAITPIYAYVLQGLSAIPGSPLIQMIIAVNVAAGLTGSSSAGLQIALPQLAPSWLAYGIEPQVIHRLACISSGGLESLPHSAAIINGMQVFGVTHKMVYKYVLVETVIFPIICAFFAAFLFSIGIR